MSTTRFTEDSVPDQTGRTAIVTGANSGIGFEAARMLARKGARVILACRNLDKARAAADRIAADRPAVPVEIRELDLGDLESVKRFADGVLEGPDRLERLDLLINNAGVMVPPEGYTKQGFELQFGTNHLGHFALTGRLLPLLRRTAGARLVVVSSGVHHFGRIAFDDLDWKKRGYSAAMAYSQSKLANLLFAQELSRRLAAVGDGTLVTAAHPGWTNTDLQRTAPAAQFFGRYIAMTPHDGALPTMRAACDPAARSGDYFGPAHLFEMTGPPVAARINKKAQDRAVAEKLFDVSEQLTGVSFGLPAAAASAAA